MGNIVNTVKKFSGNNADIVPFQRCSCLPNRIPKLGKCTCGENASSVTRKSASAINDSINGHGTVYKEVVNEEMQLATDSTSKSGCRGDTSHCTNKERETQKETICTDSKQNGDATNSKDVLICNQTSGHMSYELDDGSNKICGSLAAMVSEVLVNKVSLEKRCCCTNHEEAGDLESNPARNTRGRKRSRQHRVSPANSLLDREACEDLIHSAPNLDCSSTPNASVHDEKVPNEDKTPCPSLDVRGCESTLKASLKRRTNKKRTKWETSHQTTALNANTGALVVSVPCASFDVRGCESTPKASLKRRVHRKRTKHEASHKTTAFNANTGALAAVQPPLTLATPESLKRSTRSGRLIVPRLDPGSQNIIYDMDGSILDITNFELPRLQRPYSEPPPKRRKRSRCSSPGHGRLLLF